jgi:hypothetical protein
MKNNELLRKITIWFSPVLFGGHFCFLLVFLICTIFKLGYDEWFMLIVPVGILYLFLWFQLAMHLKQQES